MNSILTEPLSRDDVVGVYAGLRPLLAGDADTTAKLSREHTVSRVAPGLVMVAGGKFTTYRVMAAEAVDEAAARLGRPVPPSCTDRLPLVGASGFLALWNRRHELAAEHRIDPAHLEHLLNRYGDTLDQVLELAHSEPALGQPLPGTQDYLRAEAAPVVAELIASRLGWSESDVARELRHYRARVAAELQSQAEPDDQAAEAAQLRALETPLSA